MFDFGSRSPAVDCSPDKLPTSLLAAMPTVPAGREGEGSSPMTNSLSRRPLKAIKYSSSSANHKQSKDDAAKTKCVNFSDTVVVNSTEAAGNEPAASELQQSEGSVVTNTDQLCSGVPLIPTPPPPVRDVWDDPPSPGGGLCGNPVVPETELSDANRPSLSTTLPGMPNLQSAPPNLDDDLPSSKEAEIDIPLSMSTSSRPCSVQLNVQPSSGTPNQSSSNDNTQQSQVDHLQPPRKRKAGQKGKAVRKKRNSRPKQSKQSSPPPGPASNKENSDQKMVKRSRTKRAIDCVATTPTRVTRSMAAALGQKSALLHEGSAELVTTASTATTTGSEEEGETLDEVAEPDSKIPRIERESEVKDPGLSVASSTDYNALTTTVTPRVAVGQLSLPHSEICDHDDFKPITKQSEEETCTLANEVEKLPAVPSSKLASSLSSSSSADTMAIAATKNTSCELPLRTDSLCDATGNRVNTGTIRYAPHILFTHCDAFVEYCLSCMLCALCVCVCVCGLCVHVYAFVCVCGLCVHVYAFVCVFFLITVLVTSIIPTGFAIGKPDV